MYRKRADSGCLKCAGELPFGQGLGDTVFHKGPNDGDFGLATKQALCVWIAAGCPWPGPRFP